ncbi:alpha-2-macroglobulin-like protein 1 isoform X2 [Microcaecilia unicolor]|uniref:Alpha-2-macroglobulin-like protein 1 isoform X2 n=1 Tax=Microcaecilia unicolor TaxID=1415580 RepID=A0A6P7WRS4_9AMPH|nr:alpha-2-macroglobulin-like protein 1 isoform X2 [Microcaecilia unicolor]
MWAAAAVLTFLLLQVQTAGTQEPPPNFSVLLPAQLWHPSTPRACVLISYLKDPAQLTVELQTSAKKQTIFRASGSLQELFHCFQFQVPPPAGGSEEVAVVSLRAQGSSYQFKARKTVLIRRKDSKTIIQTDKPTYKAGQTVNVRIVNLDENFRSSTDKLPLVQLQDPDGNQIGQWFNVLPQHGIVDLSFSLSIKPALGTYTFIAGNARHTFTVEASELEKFLVVFQLPPVVSLSDKSFQFNVCAWYTYGKPVQGLVKISVCHRYYRNAWYGEGPKEDSCQNITGKMEGRGSFLAVADMETLKADINNYLLSLEVQATVQEDDTGFVVHTSGNSRLSYTLSRVMFEGVDIYYQSRLPYRGKMKLTGPDDSPLNGQILHLTVRRENQVLLNETYETDNTGTASFILDTDSWGQEHIELEGWYKIEEPVMEEGKYTLYHEAAQHTVIPMFTSSSSVLQIQPLEGELPCGQDQQLTVDYIIDPKDMETSASHLAIAYFVMAKGGIVEEGQKTVEKDALRGSLTITLNIASHMAPQVRVLVYATFPNRKAMADSTLLQISKCFTNEVTLEFSVPKVFSGSKLDLQLQAAPGSLCAVCAVDHNIQLMRPEDELTTESLYNLFSEWYQGGHPSKVQEPDPCMEPGSQGRQPTIWIPSWYQRDPDINSLFKDAGLKIITNVAIIKPVDCSVPPQMPLYMGSSDQESSQYSHRQEQTLFADTWLWSLHSIGSTGNESVPVTVPDTITDWEASMFCIADIGFGLSPAKRLRAFKPFAVELTLLPSMVRGESFPVKVTVSNNLFNCIKVHVSLVDSPDFQVSLCPKCSYTRCLCADDSTTFSWNITAMILGEMNLTVSTEALSTRQICSGQETVVPDQGRTDTLIKTILVRPEGVSVEKTHSSLLCLKGTFEESVPLEVPDYVVEGSSRAYISVFGDILGPTLHNLDRLIQMPVGGGEQNTMAFVTVIYMLQYLEKTHQLTDEIKTQAYKYLISGYQQQLTYKHNDGSYSAFGKRDGGGNIRLTASVMKSFVQAVSYIPIDQQTIKDSMRWLRDQQLPSGCFPDERKGSVDDGKSLTAYVVVTLLEMGISTSDGMVSTALSCLMASARNLTSLHTHVLLAYACSLTGDVDTRAFLMELIDQQAIQSDGQLHWEYNTRSAENEGYWAQPFSFDEELTSYVLLAVLSDPDLERIDIGRASAIVRWLTRQQNAYGTYSSTQDTMVALQAVTKYAALTFTEDGEVAVTVTSAHSFQTTFHVDNRNRLLLQQASLTEIPGSYEVRANGTGCVLVQVTQRYNVPPPMSNATFSLSLSIEPQDCANSTGLLFLTIHVRYNGNCNASNMAVIEVGMLSGYSPGDDMEQVLLRGPSVKMVEIKDAAVSIYLDKLDCVPHSYPLPMTRKILVGNLQPALVKVYNYCQPENNAVMEYSALC